MSVDLDLSSVPPEDWGSYSCVFQLSGVEEDYVTKLEAAAVRTNYGKTGRGGRRRGTHQEVWRVWCSRNKTGILDSLVVYHT